MDPKVVRLVKAVKAMRDAMYSNDYMEEVLGKFDTHLSDEVDAALSDLDIE